MTTQAQMRPDDHVLVLFGATGDLAKRKLLPGLFHLSVVGLMPANYRIIGSAPKANALSDEAFRKHARDAVQEFGISKLDTPGWDEFEARLSFAAADDDDPGPLVQAVADAEQAIGGSPQRLYHLAIPPVAFSSMVGMLGASGLNRGAKVIIEKPFGTDLASAKALNAAVHAAFDESQVFRIDHYLGKEPVDNLLAARFANGLFEPIWNREHIDSVQIDVPQRLSIEGRASFYEGVGAFRDMVATHLFQLLGFVAMDPPAKLDGDHLRDQTTAAFNAIKPLDPKHVVRGQYEGYRDSDGVAPDSDTETFVAVEIEIDNDRWRGVPFYLRTGKSLAVDGHVISLILKRPSATTFEIDPAQPPDVISFDLTEPGAIYAEFLAKVPGPTMDLGRTAMRFHYGDSFAIQNDLEGYERLIHDAMLGNQTLFTRADGIERLWEVSEPLLQHPEPVQPYPVGSWGPSAADAALIAPGRWHLPDRVLHDDGTA